MSRPHENGQIYFVVDALTMLVESSVYFISLFPAVAIIHNAWEHGVWSVLFSLIIA